MKRFIALLILLFSVHLCFGQTDAKSEVCEVYKAVLGDEKPLVISESIIRHIEFGKRWRFSKRNPELATVQAVTLKSFKKDSYWCEIKDFVNIEPKKTLITDDETNSFFEKLKINRDADLAFIEKYKTDHYYEFSNIGFNKKKDQALLTLKWQSISFTGSDTYYFVLSKINGKWRVVRKEVIESS
jgi:hypothetical protein